ncbi:hypothetical protein [Sphingomonas abietis]|uniref:DUF11 domain-containing protein n=1 Tax=Sphingomonas abietis TaxID=3012344 RepID=A0ABY7NNN3_9SPHN|nr:hypothetical protein [Sphingomonas abietis]WBO23149.1 hypothetical protein PBT88_03135 [Sphingomonas abietis]
MMLRYGLCAAIAVATALPAFAAPVELVTKVLAEQRTAAKDGTTQIALTPAARVTPGDRIVYEISYRNTGSQPIGNFVVSNPLPKDVAYMAPAAGSPAPDLSVDGSTFGPLATLRVKGPKGDLRPAIATDVKAVRWRLAEPLAAGGSGQFAFRAMLK